MDSHVAITVVIELVKLQSEGSKLTIGVARRASAEICAHQSIKPIQLINQLALIFKLYLSIPILIHAID